MPPSRFTGRALELRLLGEQLKLVENGQAKALVISGRRRIGKSRLAQEFCDRSGRPYLIFQATRGRNPRTERAALMEAIGRSNLGDRRLVEGVSVRDWNQALRTLAFAIPDGEPTIIVIDEVPWLIEQDLEFEGALQTEWDQELSRKSVLLLLIGSDLAVMESLQEHGRPFFGRAAHHILRPLNVADVASMLDLPAADAVDAFLVTGGFPEIVQSWQPGSGLKDFLRASFANPLSPLLMAGRLSTMSEFPEPTLTRATLEAIGSGERTFSTIAAKAGGGGQLLPGTISPILSSLLARRAVALDLPLSTRLDDKNKRYRVDDSYLRFWLSFLQEGIAEAERGRGDLVLARVERSWLSWRGRAVEPLIRESLARLLPDDRWPDTTAVGAWWNRQNNPEVDLIGADRAPGASRVHFVGSIKWLDDQKFSAKDHAKLLRDTTFVPGAGDDVSLVVVSRSGVEERSPLASVWGPKDLLTAWS